MRKRSPASRRRWASGCGSSRKAVDELARAAQAAGIDDTAFQARLREVQDMLGRAMTPELEQRLRDLQAALARLDPDATRDALRRLAEAQQELRETLERSEQLFRRAAVEGQLASLAQDAEALRHDQAEWNRDAARRADSAAAAAERDLAGRADSLAAGIAQADRDLAAARRAAPTAAARWPISRGRRRRARGAMQQAAAAARSDPMLAGRRPGGSEALAPPRLVAAVAARAARLGRRASGGRRRWTRSIAP